MKLIYRDDYRCIECHRKKNEVGTPFAKRMCKVCYEKIGRHKDPEKMAAHRMKSVRFRKAHGEAFRKYHRQAMWNSRRTKTGYLRHKYLQMQARIKGRLDRPVNSWKGKDICSRADFLRWSLRNRSFHSVFNSWLKCQDDAKKFPSIDRLDNTLGYTIGNMRWCTHSENSSGSRVQ